MVEQSYTVRVPKMESREESYTVNVPVYNTVEVPYTVNVPYTETIEQPYTFRFLIRSREHHGHRQCSLH